MNWFPFLLAVFVGYMSMRQIISALRTGKVGFILAAVPRTREDSPAFFWGVIGFWVFVIAICIYRIIEA